MNKDELLATLKQLDGEVYGKLQDEICQQRYELSLMPTMNAESPLAAYLEGSVLANSDWDYHAISQFRGFEQIAAERAEKLFGAEHAIVRIGGTVAATRIVCKGMLNDGDSVVSFNGRKKEHCEGLAYNFVPFYLKEDAVDLDWQGLEDSMSNSQAKLLIYSPTSYSRNVDYSRLANIAHDYQALLWVDLGQKVGQVAAGLQPSPFPAADIATFATDDAIHGPEGAVILCKGELQERLDESVVLNGHSALHRNRLAALAVALREAETPEFAAYGQQVIKNAQIMWQTLQQEGCKVLCGGTDSHLVMVAFPENISLGDMQRRLAAAGFLVKTSELLTGDGSRKYHVLRLSTLNPTTRSLKENDIKQISVLLAKAMTQDVTDSLKKIRDKVGILLMDKPIFSEEWLPKGGSTEMSFDGSDKISAHDIAANEKKSVLKRIFNR